MKRNRSNSKRRQLFAVLPSAWPELDDAPMVALDVGDARFEVEMARRLSDAVEPGWWERR